MYTKHYIINTYRYLFLVFHRVLQIDLTENAVMEKLYPINRSDPDYVVIDLVC